MSVIRQTRSKGSLLPLPVLNGERVGVRGGGTLDGFAPHPHPLPAAPPRDASVAGAPAKCNVLVDIDLAQPDHLASGPHRLDAQAECRGAACRLDDGIGAATRGAAPRQRDRVFGLGVDAGSGTHARGELELLVIDV